MSDLTATNEFLLDQNAALRVNGKRNGTVPAAVAITAASSVAQTRQVIASVATVPVSLATVSTCNPVVSMGGAVPAVSIAPAQAQLLANSQQILGKYKNFYPKIMTFLLNTVRFYWGF